MARDCLSKALSLVNLAEAGPGSPVRDSRGWTVLHMAATHSKPQTGSQPAEEGIWRPVAP